jgi:F-type H+-transporting ATPase subunit b
MRGLVLTLALCSPIAFAQEHRAEAKEEHGEAKGEHDAGHDNSTAMWKWANFAILAGLLGYAIAKNAGPFFRGRTSEIQSALLEARKLKEDADTRASAIEQRLANLGADLAAMKAEGHQEMEAEMQRVQAETDRLLTKIRNQARQEIESAEKQAIAELRAHASELALELAEQKIRARMTASAQAQLVDQFLRRIEPSKGPVN